ncbi:MAG TPA: HD domain-containing protein [Firmicutes bacterium]|mgnify:CR=1 FL=1|nr:HD domain-containing protein [Bacillota bacterium]
MDYITHLTERMLLHTAGDPKRAQHFLKVHAFAHLIGQKEGLCAEDQFILETAALVHDIGIYAAQERHGSTAGIYQEMEGPALAETMLYDLGFPEKVIPRVAELVGRHHTFAPNLPPDHQILMEADALVNLYEDGAAKEQILGVYHALFRTKYGRSLCRIMFGLPIEADSASAEK